jgi:hypothetical protein
VSCVVEDEKSWLQSEDKSIVSRVTIGGKGCEEWLWKSGDTGDDSRLQSEDKSIVSSVAIGGKGCEVWPRKSEDTGDTGADEMAHSGSSDVEPRGQSTTPRDEGSCS